MNRQVRNRLKWYIIDKSEVTIPYRTDGGDVGKEDRLAQVLDLLAESGLALPPSAIYRNLVVTNERVTFQPRSMKNYMPELADRGLVQPIDPKALDEKKVESGKIGDCYYMITDAGRAWLEDYHS